MKFPASTPSGATSQPPVTPTAGTLCGSVPAATGAIKGAKPESAASFESQSGGSAWELSVEPCRSDAPTLAERARFLQHFHPLIERHLQAHPAATQVRWDIPILGRIKGRRVEAGETGQPLTLRLATDGTAAGPAIATPTGGNPASNGGRSSGITLPDDRLAERGARLVGLDAIADDILLDLRLRAGGGVGIAAWAQHTGAMLPAAFEARYQSSAAVYLLEGLPGSGKSVQSRAIADRYCREHCVAGTLHELDTSVRGDGTVGDFSARVRAVFDALGQSSAPARFLICDEIDAVALRRSATDQHQEDRAAAATLLQQLDALPNASAKHPASVVAVFLTTNRRAALDPALLRRLSGEYRFGPLEPAARRTLLASWLPDWPERGIVRAVRAASGMSPADIENALLRVYRAALCTKTMPEPAAVLACLRQHPRTEEV